MVLKRLRMCALGGIWETLGALAGFFGTSGRLLEASRRLLGASSEPLRGSCGGLKVSWRYLGAFLGPMMAPLNLEGLKAKVLNLD